MTEATNGRDAVSAFAGRIAALHAQTEQARAALVDTTASASSPDGSVTLSVNPAGVLTAIQFGPASRDLPSTELAAAVLATLNDARIAVLRDAAAKVAAAVGEATEPVALLQRQIEELIQAAPPKPGDVADDNDDDDHDDGYGGRGL
ncbi:YbaB/EbfC DNA-binding family protein [Jatrophihabitans sp. GAS493]|uniref:YbaB/EbfC family nucleoid-associated protein n=1 Tax=Jatrophihabitans sp. GAS493 TaxID=1907575 RepID=UPI000BC0058B|nr:YbaB/EbfC family nucleoid-associated protein [Jatrophihabitans sp. GAS493]SOD73058.1 YbaB/EbfC DNA-binding family protein [Jatrophihabitans sp. GAS493]